MSARKVRKIAPESSTQEISKPFSEYRHSPNLVLLGDPGAGKTHLFRESAASEMTHAFLARDFLNLDISAFEAQPALFIDALDEKRAGRGDESTVDAIVSKLSLVRPQKVRIACRAADWLGETDLSAFDAYFSRSGGCVVLSLEPLTSEEQEGILLQRGYKNPRDFMAAATARGLDELLSNPQNLIMLADVVERRDWPKNRTELFGEAVNLLLTEHNVTHTRRHAGAYTADELLEAAGAACAVRLISDIDGVSLANSTTRQNFPTYRSIAYSNPQHVLAALGRRVFEAGPLPETVDYTHRTLAEFLAASWIAKRVLSGLPLGRVRALLGFEGRPASELRGLHAWLTVFLNESAELLIEADPFGVLSYGDAASLAPRLRQCLLEALARLAKTDPWFRAGNWTSSAVASLSGSDMEERFGEILKNASAGFTLRSIVLDALAYGPSLPRLIPALHRILLSARAPYSERARAFSAILHIDEASEGAITASYFKLGVTADEIRLRAEILRRLYGTIFGPKDVATLLQDALGTRDLLIGGALWFVPDSVPEEDVIPILRELDSRYAKSQDVHLTKEWRNAFEVGAVLDKLLVRYLRAGRDVTGETLWRFLSLRHRCVASHGAGSSQELAGALSENAAALGRLIDCAINALDLKEQHWGFLHMLSQLTLNTVDDRLLIDHLMASLGQRIDDKSPYIYEWALMLSFRLADPRSAFEILYNFADDKGALRPIRDRCCFVEIPDWRYRQVERRKAHAAKRDAVKAANKRSFEQRKDLIRNGVDLGWMGFLGKLYWGLFVDVPREAQPNDRLISELGKENAVIAREGFRSLLSRRRISSLAEIVDIHKKNAHLPWWYAVIAALNEYVDSADDLSVYSDEFWRSVIAIECLHPVFRTVGNSMQQLEHIWKQKVLGRRPELFRDAYLALARADIANGASHVQGLHELMNLKPLKPYRKATALALLEEFPEVSGQALRQLLPAALDDLDSVKLRQILDRALKDVRLQSDLARRGTWFAIGLIIAPEEFMPLIRVAPIDTASSVIWHVRDFAGPPNKLKFGQLSVGQVEFLVDLAGRHYTKVGPPLDGWSGDTNPWDAAEFVVRLVNWLSTNTSDDAERALTRLSLAPALKSYADDIKHAAAQQRIRRIDDKFRQPTWKEVIEALRNGRPANVADLHALVIAHLKDLNAGMRVVNTDTYKRFWNESSHGHVTSPKIEESCRDALVELLRPRLQHHGVRIEPEGHMAADKRADIVAFLSNMKVVVELKRDFHQEVWTAAQDQLERFYTQDPEARGYGIYGVFWFGSRRRRVIPNPPKGIARPRTADQMQNQLAALVPFDRREHIEIIVLDVTAPFGDPPSKRQAAKRGGSNVTKSPKRRRPVGVRKAATPSSSRKKRRPGPKSKRRVRK